MVGVVAAVTRVAGVPPPATAALDGVRGDVAVPAVVDPPAGLAGPDLIGAAHEALIARSERRSGGVHYTPPALAAGLVAWALAGVTTEPGSVVDPAVGAGAFLLALARRRFAAGASPTDALAGLHGFDIDPVAVASAEAVLATWAATTGPTRGLDRAGFELAGLELAEADGLTVTPGRGTVPRGGVDLVVGNPPFLGQLASATARDRAAALAAADRLGVAAGYVDQSLLFLAAAVDLLRPGGLACLLLPEPVVSTRDGAAARAVLAERATMDAFWVGDDADVGAEVRVVAPCLVRRGRGSTADPGRATGRVRIAVGPRFVDAGSVARTEPTSWAPMLAGVLGVPAAPRWRVDGTLGGRAAVRAGFRQHFYAVAAALLEGDEARGGEVPLAVTGLVDPLAVRWGDRPARVDGRMWTRPVVDLDRLAAADPRVAEWFSTRRGPQVLVATQTRVVEAAVDAEGRFLPAVPLLSVAPLDGGGAPLWELAAVLLAPPVTAWALHQAAGAARGRGALKLSATQVRSIPLPADRAAWAAAAGDLAAGAGPEAFGRAMTSAYGLAPDDPVVAWWLDRLGSWRGTDRSRPQT